MPAAGPNNCEGQACALSSLSLLFIGILLGTKLKETIRLKMMKDQDYDRYIQKVAGLLIYARKKAGLSLRQLAANAGTSHSTISAYESGKKVPSTTTFLRLMHACNFSVDFVLSPRIRGDEENPKGRELEQVLSLAAEFPVNHDQTRVNATLIPEGPLS